MKSNSDPYQGALQMGDGLNLPYIWCAIHLSAQVADQFGRDPGHAPEVMRMEKSDLFLLETLQKVDPEAWLTLCAASGWTAYGAIALSWCPHVTLAQVGHYFGISGYPVQPGDGFDRAARLLNPKLLPKGRKLTDIAEIAGSDPTAFCIALRATDELAEWNLTESALSNAPQQVAAFLSASFNDIDLPPEQRAAFASL